jgi:chromate transport protein ChrA
MPEVVTLADFMTRCEAYFGPKGCIIDQPFQARLPDGMIRCYMGQDKVVGYGHQLIKALIEPPPEGPDSDAAQPGPRIMHPASAPMFQTLRSKMETEWTHQMMRLLDIDRDALPIIWDADFLYGPRTESGEDTYVLCEINVSSVFAIPDEAPEAIARLVTARLRANGWRRAATGRVALGALFWASLKVSLFGAGGGIVWAHRTAVDQRKWTSEEEFTDIVSFCQFMPGPNVVGIAVRVGAKPRGSIEAIAAVLGFLLIPWTIGFTFGMLFLQYARIAVIRNIFGGVSAAAAGLLIATGLRMPRPHRTRPAALVIAALGIAFAGIESGGIRWTALRHGRILTVGGKYFAQKMNALSWFKMIEWEW